MSGKLLPEKMTSQRLWGAVDEELVGRHLQCFRPTSNPKYILHMGEGFVPIET